MHNFEDWMSAKNQKIQMWEMVMLFEDSKEEMYRLMRHSFARFRRHESFDKIKEYFNEKLQNKLKAKTPRRVPEQNKVRGKEQNGDYLELESESPGGHRAGIAGRTETVGSASELVDATDIIADIKNEQLDD